MKHFFINRISKRNFGLSLTLGIAIALFQIYQSIKPSVVNSNIFMDSPYTSWIGVDPFNFSAVMFYILLPIIAALPAGAILREDLNNNFFNQEKIRKPVSKLISGYALTAFLSGMLVIAIPLIINFIIYFAILPNVVPDNLLNINMGIINKNTFLVVLYYSHPFVHAILNILWCALWGGIFALISATFSLYVKNYFVTLFSGMLIQIAVMSINMILITGDKLSFSPVDFLRETPSASVDLKFSIILTIITLAACIAGLIIGKKNVVE